MSSITSSSGILAGSSADDDLSVATPQQGKTAKGGLLRKGFWAVMDQGLFAGSNCVVNVMLAKWLAPVEYGAFSTAFAGFLMLGVIHTAMLTEPMLVFGSDRYKSRLGQYLGALAGAHVVLSLLASLVLFLSGLFLSMHGQHDLARALYCFAVTGPFTLFLWLMRRACYAQMNPRRAAMAGIGYLIMMMIGLVFIHQFHLLSIATALALMAISSMVAGLWLAAGKVRFTGMSTALLRDVASDHWRYGRWATATALLSFIPGNIYYFLLPKFTTLAESGALRALSNLYNPFLQANAALCLLLLPAFVRTRGTPEGKRMHRIALLVLAGGPLVYWIVFGLANKQIINLVYGGNFKEYSPLLWIIGFQPVIAGMCGVYGSLLRANQKMNAVFCASLVAAVAAVILGVTMMKRYGLAGVCWSIVLTYALHHITLWLFSRSMGRRDASRQSRSATDENGDAASMASQAA